MRDSRAIFDFLRIQKPPADRPTGKKEGHKIDSFKGVLDPEMSKFYATLGSCFPFTSIIRDGFYFLLILA